MGCENSVVTPGRSSSTFSISCVNSSLVFPEVHSLLSFKIIIISAASIGIGSVGISDEPIFDTIIFISGNLTFNNFSAFVVVSISCESELPEAIIMWVAMSPSSKFGINSPPKFEKINNETANNPNETPIINPLISSAFSKIGW